MGPLAAAEVGAAGGQDQALAPVAVGADPPASAEPPAPPAPPPPQPPAAPAVRNRPPPVVRQCPRWEIPGFGWLVHDDRLASFNAHCTEHGYVRCRFNKTLLAGRREAQGRPIGQLLQWLRDAPNHTSKESHFAAKRRDDETKTWASRDAAGQWGKTLPTLAGVWELERPRRDGKRDEPIGFLA